MRLGCDWFACIKFVDVYLLCLLEAFFEFFADWNYLAVLDFALRELV